MKACFKMRIVQNFNTIWLHLNQWLSLEVSDVWIRSSILKKKELLNRQWFSNNEVTMCNSDAAIYNPFWEFIWSDMNLHNFLMESEVVLVLVLRASSFRDIVVGGAIPYPCAHGMY